MSALPYHIRIIPTNDGSYTFQIPEWNETYHSVHGAFNESMHVFIKNGLETFYQHFHPSPVIVGEAGFGTGLNAFLTLKWALQNRVPVAYETYEKFPISREIAEEYAEKTGFPDKDIFMQLHESEWNKPVILNPYFTLHKRQKDFREIDRKNYWHVFYFDAFSPRVQPELWELSVLKRIFEGLQPGGIFVTYSAKGSVRRNLVKAGFQVERLPGPPGKREMLRGIKPR